MASQVTQGLTTAGLILAAGGLALGMYPAGEDCGSPWSPATSSYAQDVPASCALTISERQPMAWLMLIGGSAVLFGGLVARPKLEPVAAAEEEPSPHGVGQGPLVP
ncbi:hypothetical protein ACFVVU_23620 [Kitasatospora sp. NPDC057965]|uniref:hypothetical protein n=1 Tax=Kitasatospora sp. NPDC057965 TaxID=3346291 RepID=UPI0036DD0EEA